MNEIKAASDVVQPVPFEPSEGLKRLYSIAEIRAAARRVLPRPVFDFADGGAEDERTLRRNEAAFDDV